jgi:cephalosporin hydroxylase
VEHFYQDIDGWFDFENLYREAVRRMPIATRDLSHDELQDLGAHSKMVEVGVYKGRSCFFLAVEAFNSGKTIHVVAVDNFTMAGTSPAEFSRLRREHGLTEMISIIEATSVQASRQFDDETLDFVFIDADHEYESVKADIAAWWPKVKPGGILAGHDFAPEFPGVKQAVIERFDGPNVSLDAQFRVFPPRSWWVDKNGGPR